MALNYLSGRVSRFGVGVPGFSTDRELVLDVAGAIGIGTTLPRASADFPNLSIRGELYDAGVSTGGLGYFLSQDAEGVKWVAASPEDLTFIRVYENDVQVGVSSFSGLNFKSPDPFFLNIEENGIGPNIADINYDVRWIKTGFGNNFGIATGFGTDGTYASIPGYGTSDAVGVTSVGIGTNNPLDDFQVGIGSTGVTINGPLGKIEAQTIKAKNVEIDGNITVESLVVDPGISTFRGNIDAQGISSFTGDVLIGFASITDSELEQTRIGLATINYATIGPIGAGASLEPALFVTGLSTFAGIVTTLSDLYVGNDLYVGGEQFIEQLNANNVKVTGIATINQTEIAGAAITDLAVSGITTLADFTANVGVVTQLDAEDVNAGVGSFGSVRADDAVITEGVVGILTANDTTTLTAQIGVATIGFDTGTPALDVTGESSFTGFTTFQGDVSVSGILTVGTRFDVPNIGVEFLTVSGIATINQVEFNVGIGSTLNVLEANVGVGSFGLILTDEIVAAAGTIGGVGFDSGRVDAIEIDAERGYIGILTGDLLSYGIGTITDFTASEAGITTATVQNLIANSNSFINGVGFNTDLVTITQNLEVLGITTFRGVGTFGTDLYVGNDLYVGGETFFEQINAVNLDVTGIGTVNQLEFNVGFGSTATFLEMEVGVGTITNFDSEVGFVSYLSLDRLAVIDPLDPLPPQFTLPPPVGSAYISQIVTNDITAANSATVGFGGLDVLGETTTFNLFVQANGYIERLRFNSGVGTHLELETLQVGLATVQELDVEEVDIERADVGIATVGDLTVTGITTFEGVVNIDDVVFINQEVTGISSINELRFNVGIGTSLLVEQSQTGVATVGLASITNLEASSASVGVATIGYAQVGLDSTKSALLVTGINTFIGFTTFTGDVFIDGGLTVTGPATYAQLDAQQSQIGILTVFDILDSQKDTFLNNVAIAGSFVASGVSTIGLSTFTPDGDVQINRNLVVGGITTFIGQVNIDDTAFINLEVTETARINNLFVNVGIATTFSVADLDANVGVVTSLSVTGASTFTGVGTFQNDLYVADNLYVKETIFTKDEVVTGLSSIANANIGVATVGFSTVDEAFIGILTTGALSVESLIVDPGISTFRGDVFMSENLDVAGITSTGDLDVVGVASIGIASIRTAFVDFLDFGTSVGGASSVGFATVGLSTTTSALTVQGISTFSGLTTFIGDVFVDGDLFITGISSFQTVGADFGLIGILTVSNYLEADDLIVTGFTTLSDYSFNVGVGSTLSLIDANVSGILSTNNLFINEDLEVGRNLVVNGISTLGAPGPTGFTTTLGDLYVGGDLFVLDDIFYDEIVGRNLLISGIATITELRYAVGFGTTANIEELNFNVGIGTTLTVENLTAGIATVGVASLTDVVVGGALTVVGLSSFNDRVYIEPQLHVRGNATVSGILTASTGIFTDFQANSGLVTSLITENFRAGIATIVDAEVGVGTFGTIVVGFLDAGAGIGTIGKLDVNTNLTVSGLTSTGDLIVDNNAIIGGATSTGDLVAAGDVDFRGNLSVAGDTNLNSVSITTALVGEAGINSLTVNQSFYSTGVSTFAAGLTVAGIATFTGILTAVNGTIENLDGNLLSYNTGIFTSVTAKTGIITESLGVAQTTTTLDLNVGRYADILQLNVGVAATIRDLEVPNNAYIENLSFNTGIGTNLTVETGTFDQIGVGTVTVDNIGIGSAIVGILTVTQQIDHELDATSTSAAKVNTIDAAPTALFTVPSGFASAEFTVTGIQGSNYISSKIHALNTGSNVFFNEYSFLSSGPDFAALDVIPSAGGMILQATVANGIPAQFTIHSVAHKA